MKVPLATAPALLIAVHLCNHDFEATAQSWIPTLSPLTNWNCVSCSANGASLVAGSDQGVDYLWTSIDGGGRWVANTSTVGKWSAVASSADGGKLFAADPYNGIYISTNLGSSWAVTGAHETGWGSLACSGDGSRLLAGGWRTLHTSTNSGVTWTPAVVGPDMTNQDFRGVASSADGTQLVAVTQNNEVGGLTGSMYLSRDAGRTWEALAPITNAPTSFWSEVACSADGSTIVAAGFRSGVFVSTNAGASWTRTNILSITSVACSADGARMAAVGWSGRIHTSNDAGRSWAAVAPAGTSAYWMAIACSADGCKMAAAVDKGQIWVWQTTPTPHLEITQSGENLVLSWLVPSMPFVLQESQDLATTNWDDVMIAPSLNYTNIHYEVTVPAPAGSRYYRLSAPP